MTSPVRPWWREALLLGSVGLVVLAVAALAGGGEDARVLRLGIVAALWAALLGAFAAARMRRDVSSGADRTEELRTVYQLELEREIAARREHELTVERELREQIERRERADITALRTELQSLRDTLQNLLGRDVLVERVALRAESTRLLPLPDHSRTFADSRGRAPADAVTPRSLTVSEWPAAEDNDLIAGSAGGDLIAGSAGGGLIAGSAGGGLIAGSAGGSRIGGSAEPRPAAESSGDIGFLDRSWRPAVSRTPSWDVATDAIGSHSHRRAEPDLLGQATGEASVNDAPGRVSESSGESPIWNSLVSSRNTPPAEPGSNGSGPQQGSHPGSETQGKSPGAHRGGRAVGDLLAAYGKDSAPSRHRRQDG